mmetsp:Transcript_40052/g.96650  ORF Transcript_40052/g.96650 Transcript_40052/m.96650 type:complete len:208 (-) Transcript_40052:922-1545(-)
MMRSSCELMKHSWALPPFLLPSPPLFLPLPLHPPFLLLFLLLLPSLRLVLPWLQGLQFSHRQCFRHRPQMQTCLLGACQCPIQLDHWHLPLRPPPLRCQSCFPHLPHLPRWHSLHPQSHLLLAFVDAAYHQVPFLSRGGETICAVPRQAPSSHCKRYCPLCDAVVLHHERLQKLVIDSCTSQMTFQLDHWEVWILRCPWKMKSTVPM